MHGNHINVPVQRLGTEVVADQPEAAVAKQDRAKLVQSTQKSVDPKDDESDSDGGTIDDSDNENERKYIEKNGPNRFLIYF